MLALGALWTLPLTRTASTELCFIAANRTREERLLLIASLRGASQTGCRPGPGAGLPAIAGPALVKSVASVRCAACCRFREPGRSAHGQGLGTASFAQIEQQQAIGLTDKRWFALTRASGGLPLPRCSVQQGLHSPRREQRPWSPDPGCPPDRAGATSGHLATGPGLRRDAHRCLPRCLCSRLDCTFQRYTW